MAKNFSQLSAKMSPEAQARSTARAVGMQIEMQLQEWRNTKDMPQVSVVPIIRVEQREDIYFSTLREYVKALGGELKLVASFPEGDIQV
jgi:hypothetical protein